MRQDARQVEIVASHTIQEAVRLTGKGRATIYRHMDSGKLAYTIGVDDRRYFDTSELIRVYGQLKEVRQDDVSKANPIETAAETLANLVDEVRLLRKENRKLTGLIETVQRQMEERPLVLPAPDPVPTQPAQVVQEPSGSVETKPMSMGDLRARMKERDAVN